MDLGEKRDEKNLVMNESSPKAPNLDSISLDAHIEETIETQAQAQAQAQFGNIKET